MGMSASQARLIALTERMNDIEYQGQQINQQRTTLSNQVNALYNSLLDMDVPTPPSTRDFTKVVYSGANGATNFTMGSIVPTGNEYTVTLNYQKTGHYISEEGTTKIVKSEPTFSVSKLDNSAIKGDDVKGYPSSEATSSQKYTEICDKFKNQGYTLMHQVKGSSLEEGDVYYVRKDDGSFEEHTCSSKKPSGNVFVKLESPQEVNTDDYNPSEDGELNWNKATDYLVKNDEYTTNGNYKTISQTEISNYFVIEGSSARVATEDDFEKVGDNKYQFKAGVEYGKRVAKGKGAYEAENPNYQVGGNTVNGCEVYTLDDARTNGHIAKDDTLKEYKEALYNAYPNLGKDADEVAEKFYVYFTEDKIGNSTPHFVLREDVDMALTDENGVGWCTYGDYVPNGTYTSSVEEKGCSLEFDAEGRITKIGLPVYNKEGELTGYKEIPLSAEEVTDDAAYKDAFNQYEYSKHLYDKQQEEINAKTSIVQAQDKNLELKLTRLDNERNAVNTEIEAVKKVVQDNIDKSFKTFSG